MRSPGEWALTDIIHFTQGKLGCVFPVGILEILDEDFPFKSNSTHIPGTLVKTECGVNISLANQMLNESHSWRRDNIVGLKVGQRSPNSYTRGFSLLSLPPQ